MKYIHVFTLVSILAILSFACNTTKTSTGTTGTTSSQELTQEDADKISAKRGPTTLGELQEGGKLYATDCSGCHALKKPKSQYEAGWIEIVPIMVKKTNAKAGREQINARNQELILKYLIAMCNK